MVALIILIGLILPWLIIPTMTVGRLRRRLRTDRQQQNGLVNSLTAESLGISGLMLIKTFTREREIFDHYKDQNRSLMDLQVREALVGRWYFMLLSLVTLGGPAVIYWVGGELFLLDPTKADISLFQGILISGGSLTIGWLLYDAMCKSILADHPTVLMLLLFVILVIMSWGYNQIFTGRAALLHLGAFTATIMTANVFFQIMPNQRVVVEDLKAGRTPDAKYGKIAKLRSTHNNYLTLPIIFIMISNHYPLLYGNPHGWAILAAIGFITAFARHYFNLRHRDINQPWILAVAAVLTAALIWLVAPAPATTKGSFETHEAMAMPSHPPSVMAFTKASGNSPSVSRSSQ